MTLFDDCPGQGECAGVGLAFDPVCARRAYPDLDQFLGGLELYFNRGLRPGHFLTAVLRNDLQDAFGRGDPGAIAALPQLMELLVNHVPASKWGSREAFDTWRQTVAEQRAGQQRVNAEDAS